MCVGLKKHDDLRATNISLGPHANIGTQIHKSLAFYHGVLGFEPWEKHTHIPTHTHTHKFYCSLVCLGARRNMHVMIMYQIDSEIIEVLNEELCELYQGQFQIEDLDNLGVYLVHNHDMHVSSGTKANK